MELVGKIYEIWESDAPKTERHFKLQGFRDALKEEGFRWSESSGLLDIHDGGDIMSDEKYKVGELRDNKIFVYGSKRLDHFLENYDNV